jgi:PAS domain S-box-containing protein
MASQDLRSVSISTRSRPSALLLLAGFVVLACLIAVGGYLVWRQQGDSMRVQAERSVNAVARLKADQIAAWLDERHADAEVVGQSRWLADIAAGLASGRASAAARVQMVARLRQYRDAYGYSAALLLTGGGRILAASPQSGRYPPGVRTSVLARDAFRTQQIVWSDLYLGPDGRPRLETATPLVAPPHGQQPAGVIVFASDPAQFLYPVIQDWPLPATSGETLLVERRGDRVVYLNELRFRKGAALHISLPLTKTELPAVMAVTGRRGAVTGRDYRGVPVFAGVQPVRGTSWHVVAKLDSAEVMAPIDRRGLLTAAVTLLLVAVAGLATLLIWRSREAQVNATLLAGEQRYRTLLETLSAGVVVYAADTSIALANAAATRLLGTSEDELLGTRATDPAWRFLAEDGSPLAHELYPATRVFASGEGFDDVVTGVARTPPLEPVWLLCNAHPVTGADGAVEQVVVTFTDISERKTAQDEARRFSAELERRVEARTAELDAANRELEAFAYSVSHDLRAPLRHISGFSSLLAERSADSLDERGRHYVDVISRSVNEMGVLIDDLLQFSRTGRAELNVERVDMDVVVREALAPLRQETDGRDIRWDIESLPPADADRSLIRQVWANLLGNAIKYTVGETPARIQVRGARTDAEVVYAIQDNGVGFDMQYAHKLFGVFQRLHDSSEFEGTGIGLANVHRIVTRLNGRVWAEGEPGRGATFSFSLPARKETT